MKQVQVKLRAENVEVTIDPNSGVLRLPEATLFAKGSAVVTPAGQAVLAKIGATLQAELPCYTSPGAVPASCPATKSGLESVFIEGHSDSDRMVGDRDNWNLSTDRAVNTYRSLIGSTPALESIKDARVRPNDPQPVFGVSGYGPSRPLVPETSEAAKARNRRIDIRFLMATPAAAAH